MKKILTFIVAIVISNAIFAQEEAIFTQAPINIGLINPAAIGADREHQNVFMNIRSAFTNFPGTPKSYALTYNGAVGKQVGLGGTVFTENVADITRFKAQLAYSMGFQVQDLEIRAGMALKYQRMDLANSAVNGPLYEANDDIIERAMNGEKVFDTSLGLYATFKKRFHFGYVAPNLIRTVLDDIEGGEDGGNFKYYIFHAGGDFDVNDFKIKLKPSIVYRNIRNVDPQIDFNLTASFLKEQLITGLMYRTGTGSSLGFLLGTKYNTVRFIYSYDVYLDDFQSYNGGSHEITVGFQFNRKKGKFDRSKKYRK